MTSPERVKRDTDYRCCGAVTRRFLVRRSKFFVGTNRCTRSTRVATPGQIPATSESNSFSIKWITHKGQTPFSALIDFFINLLLTLIQRALQQKAVNLFGDDLRMLCR
jgi:hypothetical protein